MSDLLLDTCALLWLAAGVDMSDEAREAIRQRDIRVSPISAWEIANLVRKNRLTLAMRPAVWIRESVDRMDATLSELSIDILTDSCALPGQPPNDPADRIIITTARERDMTIMTRDRAILDYAQAGHVRAMEC
jgi:PIN domain nuclease of toxin-antitoxin system